MQFKQPSSPVPKKVAVIPSVGKLKVSFWWGGVQNTLFIDYVQNGHAINGEYYVEN